MKFIFILVIENMKQIIHEINYEKKRIGIYHYERNKIRNFENVINCYCVIL